MVMNALVIKVSTTEQADGHEYHNHLERGEGGRGDGSVEKVVGRAGKRSNYMQKKVYFEKLFYKFTQHTHTQMLKCQVP